MKKVIAVIIILIVLVGGGVYLKSRNTSSNTPSSTAANSSDMANMDSNNSNSSNSAAAAPVATNAVTISNFAFSPANITVKKGTTVTWTNQDSVAHTVTETDGQDGPKSGDLDNGKSYSFTFNTVGTFKYNCSIHTEMVGTVTVTD